MPEVRLIDANALAESDMAKLIDRYLYSQCNLTVGLAAALMPEIEAEPVRHGRWKKKNGVIYCTNCKKSKWSESFELMLRGFDFCPKCGARMDAFKNCCCISDEEAKRIFGGADNEHHV